LFYPLSNPTHVLCSFWSQSFYLFYPLPTPTSVLCSFCSQSFYCFILCQTQPMCFVPSVHHISVCFIMILTSSLSIFQFTYSIYTYLSNFANKFHLPNRALESLFLIQAPCHKGWGLACMQSWACLALSSVTKLSLKVNFCNALQLSLFKFEIVAFCSGLQCNGVSPISVTSLPTWSRDPDPDSGV
jgi:hypothetical protein